MFKRLTNFNVIEIWQLKTSILNVLKICIWLAVIRPHRARRPPLTTDERRDAEKGFNFGLFSGD